MVQPVSAALLMQPVPSVAWVSAPEDASRASTTTALLAALATYTFAPSPLIAMPSGAARARPVAQPLVATLVRQPVVSAGWVSPPVEELRSKLTTAFPMKDPT